MAIHFFYICLNIRVFFCTLSPTFCSPPFYPPAVLSLFNENGRRLSLLRHRIRQSAVSHRRSRSTLILAPSRSSTLSIRPTCVSSSRPSPPSKTYLLPLLLPLLLPPLHFLLLSPASPPPPPSHLLPSMHHLSLWCLSVFNLLFLLGFVGVFWGVLSCLFDWEFVSAVFFLAHAYSWWHVHHIMRLESFISIYNTSLFLSLPLQSCSSSFSIYSRCSLLFLLSLISYLGRNKIRNDNISCFLTFTCAE